MVSNFINKNNNLILDVKQGSIILNYEFIEWLAGFTDAEGNFNLVLRNF